MIEIIKQTISNLKDQYIRKADKVIFHRLEGIGLIVNALRDAKKINVLDSKNLTRDINYIMTIIRNYEKEKINS